MSEKKLTACPKCGGTNGYEGVLTMTFTMIGAWGRDWETGGHERTVYKSKNVRCMDCGKRTELKLAAGDKP